MTARSGASLADSDVLLHATTIITNAVIERKGHDFVLLHTSGFRDRIARAIGGRGAGPKRPPRQSFLRDLFVLPNLIPGCIQYQRTPTD
jgi:N-methylhydantoinase A/oxoprolinase/acetone carboxylase beta subunit